MLKRENQCLPTMLLVLAIALIVTPARGAEPYAIEVATAKASSDFPAAIVDSLDPRGSRLTTFVNGLNTTICEVWWAKTVEAQKSSPPAPGVLYGNLRVGALVGVIHYLPDGNPDYREDFRDQKLRPGYYTMRYVQMPDDKAHKDVNPYRDFVLLSSVSVDRQPDRVLTMEDMLRWSRLASRSHHPAIMGLVPVDVSYKKFPGVRTDDSGSCILQVKLRLSPEKSGPPRDLTFAIVLVTPIREGGES